MIDSSVWEFYYSAFNIPVEDKEKIAKTLEILDRAYQQICHDKTNPENEEKLIKVSLWCVKIKDETTFKRDLRVKEEFLRKLVTISKSNWNLNFKETNRWMDLLKFMKDILNNSKGEEAWAVPLRMFEEYSQCKDLYRKLNQWFNSIFDWNSESILNYKRVIWAMFIYLCHKKWSNQTNIYERLKILIRTLLEICLRIPNDFFPLRYKITKDNKWNVIETHIKSKLPHIERIDNKEMIETEINELPLALDFDLSSKENLVKIIDYYYSQYGDTFWSPNKFDERWLLCNWYQTNNNSPMKSFWYKNDNITCSRKLSFDIPSSVKNQKKSGNDNTGANRMSYSSLSMIEMTPCTRVITLNKWFSDYTRNFNVDSLDKLQLKYDFPSYSFNPNLVPLSKYVINKIKTFGTNSQFYQNLITERFVDDKSKLCLKFLNTLILSENVLFTEEYNTKWLFNENFINAIITLSFEISLWIDDEQEITFNKLILYMGVDIYDLWKVLSPFNIKYSLSIKPAVKEHIEEIEYQIISFLMWKNPSTKFKDDLQAFFKDDNNTSNQDKQSLISLADFEFNHQSLFMFHRQEDYQNTKFTQDIENGPYSEIANYVHCYPQLGVMGIFLRRVVNYCNCLNKAIFETLDRNLMTFAVESEDLIKKIITNENHIQLLYGRHLDQIVLCCIMAVLISHKILSWTTSNLSSDVIKWHNEFKNTKINIEQLYHSYECSKTGQTVQTSKLIFDNVKIDSPLNTNTNTNIDKDISPKFVGCEEFFEKHFKVYFEEVIKEVTQINNNANESLEQIAYCFDEYDNMNQHPGMKRRKLSLNYEDFKDEKNNEPNDDVCNIKSLSRLKNYNKESLVCKSAFSSKMEYYTPLKKKFEKDNKKIQYYPTWNVEKIPTGVWNERIFIATP